MLMKRPNFVSEDSLRHLLVVHPLPHHFCRLSPFAHTRTSPRPRSVSIATLKSPLQYPGAASQRTREIHGQINPELGAARDDLFEERAHRGLLCRHLLLVRASAPPPAPVRTHGNVQALQTVVGIPRAVVEGPRELPARIRVDWRYGLPRARPPD